MKPRVLIVGRSRYRLPLSPATRQRLDALGEELEVRVLASATADSHGYDGRLALVRPFRVRPFDGLVYWVGLPWRIARELRSLQPQAVLCQTAHDGAAALLGRAIARVPARVVVEVHGDWRTATRLYGSPARRALSVVADAVAAFSLKRADAVRVVSPFTARLVRELGVEPAAQFPAYLDLRAFTNDPVPLPDRPVALFVGVLEAYKNIDGLAEAWRSASTDGELHVVGNGTRADVVRQLVAESVAGGAAGVRWDPELSREEVARALDDAWVLVLPSRSEGMGRVLVEAFCRGRGVIGSRAGSIPDLVEDGVSGLLVDAHDAAALARALDRVLSDRSLAERLGEGARAAAGRWLQTPEEYARRVRELVA
jgi:glycosyltransferase involved in cell wall biosynthesis